MPTVTASTANVPLGGGAAGWGEPAARAVPRGRRAEAEAVSLRIGLVEGCDRFTGQLARTPQTVFEAVGRETVKGCKPGEVSRAAPALLGDREELLSEKVLNYAVRGAQ
ncbi:hypothetical protein [Streptomyces sp. NPDC046859]|uniref:hypothetical protein n=1 Tax=Streptomyces sp. NPDC046859 TaxID=3155734 RepID=UPI0033C95F96